MRFKLFVLLAACAAMVAAPAIAELQNVETFGSLQIRGNWYSPSANDFVEEGDSTSFYEQRTTIGFVADFSEDVSALIELDNYGFWGDSFRSDPITGEDYRGSMVGDSENVELYQGYIEMRKIGGYAIDARIGRQEVMHGSEWLLGNNSTASHFQHLSFDGITATYSADSFSVTGGAYKLHDNSGMGALAAISGTYSSLSQSSSGQEDGDTDLYLVYGTYTGIEDMTIDAYWIYLRDARDFGMPDNAELHTFGARVAGAIAGFNYEGEAAFQSGDTWFGGDFEGVGLNVEVGYGFDHELNPHVYGGAAFFSGEDTTDGSGDLGFNRLFSDWEYSEFLDDTSLSNILVVRGGASIEPTEKIGVSGEVRLIQIDDDLTDDDLGLEVGLYGTYQYSEDVAFEVGYAHLFVDDATETGAPVHANGLSLLGGGDEDADYFYVQSSISF